MVFFDDISVYSKDVASHKHHLEVVFVVLKRHKLSANRKKCLFAQPQIAYLGHLVSTEGVAADPKQNHDHGSLANSSKSAKTSRFLGANRLLQEICRRIWHHILATYPTVEERFIWLDCRSR